MNADVTLKIQTTDFESHLNDISNNLNSAQIEHSNGITLVHYICDSPTDGEHIDLLVNSNIIFDLEWGEYLGRSSTHSPGGIYNRVDANRHWQLHHIENADSANMVDIDEVIRNLSGIEVQTIPELIANLKSKKVLSFEEQLQSLADDRTTSPIVNKQCFSFSVDQSIGKGQSGYIETVTGLGIHFHGYGDMTSCDNSGTPVYFDIIDDDLHLVVFDDINQEEPSHIINLKGAQLDKRLEQ